MNWARREFEDALYVVTALWLASVALCGYPPSSYSAESHGEYKNLGSVGIHCEAVGETAFPARIVGVDPKSLAAKNQIHDGDQVISLKYDNGAIALELDREGSQFTVELELSDLVTDGGAETSSDETMLAKMSNIMAPTGWKMSPSEIEQTPSISPALSSSATVSGERKLLAEHDVVILIDKSGSMNTRDCEGGLSRWDWCKQQTMGLLQDSSNYLQNGITLVVFSNDFQVFPKAHMKEVAEIFQKYSPGGSTNTGAALYDRLRAYLTNRQANSKSTRPVVMAVITDGEPTDGRTCAEAIISSTRELYTPDEVAITFLQVGNEASGTAVLNELNDKLVEEGAKYDIVQLMSYPELLKTGLRSALVKAILERRVKPQPAGLLNETRDQSFFERMRNRLEKKWQKQRANNALAN